MQRCANGSKAKSEDRVSHTRGGKSIVGTKLVLG